MNRINKSIYLVTLFFNLQALSQTQAQCQVSVIKQDLCHFGCTGLILIKTPLEFKSKEWLTTAGVLGTTVLLFSTDKEIRNAVQRHHNPTKNSFFNLDQVYGNGYTVLLTGSVYGLGLILNKPGLRLTGLCATEAFVYSGLITAVGKMILGRRRPYAGESQLFFKPFQSKDAYHSLPSGHSMVAFAVSTVLAKSIDNTWWKIFCYGAGGMVAASRIYHNAHWLSDVFLGSAIGYVVAVKVVNSDASGSPHQSSCRVLPWCSQQRIGLTLVW